MNHFSTYDEQKHIQIVKMIAEIIFSLIVHQTAFTESHAWFWYDIYVTQRTLSYANAYINGMYHVYDDGVGT